MRAARVLDMLLVLQRRRPHDRPGPRRTLEVSERTILRDVEALSEAGVPIFTTRGAGGGIELMDGFQTHLTGLTTDEALCLFLVGQPQVAHRLGLGAPTLTARNKLLNAIAPPLAEEADRLSTWFLHDPDPWTGNRVPHGELRRLARSIHQRRKGRAHHRRRAHAHRPSTRPRAQGGLVASDRGGRRGGRGRLRRRAARDTDHQPAFHAAVRLRPQRVLEASPPVTGLAATRARAGPSPRRSMCRSTRP